MPDQRFQRFDSYNKTCRYNKKGVLKVMSSRRVLVFVKLTDYVAVKLSEGYLADSNLEE